MQEIGLLDDRQPSKCLSLTSAKEHIVDGPESMTKCIFCGLPKNLRLLLDMNMP